MRAPAGAGDVAGDRAWTAVILMAYGSPERPQDIAPYLQHIRGGEPPGPELVADLQRRYDAIGGRSPLQEVTRAQAAELGAALALRGVAARVWPAMKHSAPSIAEAVRDAHGHGARKFLGLALAPHFAGMSIGGYERALREAASPLVGDGAVEMVDSWHLEPALIEAWAGPLRALRRARPAVAGTGGHVLFTAHSLPERIVGEGDPYPKQLLETCRAVAGAARLERWSFAWQSAGSRGRWLGPPLRERLEEVAAGGADAVLSAPIGFVSDHLEVLYDLDIEARQAAERLGMRWARAPMPNGSPALVTALAHVAEARLPPAGGPP